MKTIIVVGSLDKSRAVLIDKIKQHFNIIIINVEISTNQLQIADTVIHYDGDLGSLIVKLKDLTITTGIYRIIPIAESGVELADELNERFHLSWNDYSKRAARRDKHKMQLALKDAKLNHIKGLASGDIHYILGSINPQFNYPFVIKPLKSAASDNVFVCHSESELIAGFNTILGSRDIFNNSNTLTLIQQFLAGTEYVVDTISFEGETIICAIWRYQKIVTDSGLVLYRSMELEMPDSIASKILVPYALKVLRAVGISNGASHQEIMLCESTPILIEVGARVHGGAGGHFASMATKYSVTDLLVDILLDQKVFKAYAQNGGIYSISDTSAKEIFLIASHSGNVIRVDLLPKLEQLKSFHSIKSSINVGDYIDTTTNLRTSPTSILLIGKMEDIYNDEQQIYEWERSSAFYSLDT